MFIPYPTSLKEKKNIKTSGERKTDATQYKTQNIGFPFEISCGLHGLHGIIHHVCTLPEISTLHENNSATISQALPVLRTTPQTSHSATLNFHFLGNKLKYNIISKRSQLACIPFKAFRLTVVAWTHFRP